MANVYIEARPKGRAEGEPIDDYVVEDSADQVLGRSGRRKARSPGPGARATILSWQGSDI